jgi:hypothetical protein
MLINLLTFIAGMCLGGALALGFVALIVSQDMEENEERYRRIKEEHNGNS